MLFDWLIGQAYFTCNGEALAKSVKHSEQVKSILYVQEVVALFT